MLNIYLQKQFFFIYEYEFLKLKRQSNVTKLRYRNHSIKVFFSTQNVRLEYFEKGTIAVFHIKLFSETDEMFCFSKFLYECYQSLCR